jgi:hypothetical protein
MAAVKLAARSFKFRRATASCKDLTSPALLIYKISLPVVFPSSINHLSSVIPNDVMRDQQMFFVLQTMPHPNLFSIFFPLSLPSMVNRGQRSGGVSSMGGKVKYFQRV